MTKEWPNSPFPIPGGESPPFVPQKSGRSPGSSTDPDSHGTLAADSGDLDTRAGETIARPAKFPSENPNPVLRVSRDGTILYANRASAPLLAAWRCREGEPLSGQWRGFIRDALDTGRNVQAELECHERVFSLTLAPVEDSNYVNVYALDTTDRKRAEKALRKAHHELERRVQERTRELRQANAQLTREIGQRKRLEKELSRISTFEQQRMGQELHDGLAQELLGAALMAKGLQKSLRARRLAEAAAAGKLAESIAHAQKHVRAVLQGVRPVEVDATGLVAALADLAESTQTTTGVRCAFTCGPPIVLADNQTATQLFHVAREAVRNAVKHARPGQVTIGLESQHGRLKLWVRDNGAGIRHPLHRAAGMGLRIMQHRAAVIGASLEIRPGDGAGTVVICTLDQDSGHECGH